MSDKKKRNRKQPPSAISDEHYFVLVYGFGTTAYINRTYGSVRKNATLVHYCVR